MKKITLMLFALCCFVFSFTSKAQCNYTIELYDDYGDGWNGGSINVLVNGTAVLTNVTITAAQEDYASFTFSVESGDDVTTAYTPGSYSYENGYRILNSMGVQVFESNWQEGDGPPEAVTTGTIEAVCPACTQAIITSSTVVDDCANSQFSVNVDITSVGDAVEISNGTATWAVSGTGVVTVGPFAVGSSQTLTVVHSDTDCNLSIGSFAFACPPSNTSCADATAVSCGQTINGTSVGSTGTAEDIGCTMGINGVWYAFEGTGGDITVTTTASFDHRMGISRGSCGAFTNIVCRDGSVGAETHMIPLTTLGETYYVYIAHYSSGNTTTGTHSINIACATPPDCTAATVASSTRVDDCANNQFSVDVDITSVGDAVEISNGTTTWPVSGTGIVTVGPFAVGGGAQTLTLVHSDTVCNIALGSFNLAACPPANDTCDGVIDLGSLVSPINGTTVGANNNFVVDCLTSTSVADVVYSIVVPDGYTLSIGQTENGYDSKHRLAYGGACPGENLVACIDDPEFNSVTWVNTTGSDQTAYWVQSAFSGSGTFTLAWTLTAPPEEAPECATNLVATLGDCGNSDTVLSWDAVDGADGYYVTVGTTNGGNDVLDTDVSGTSVSVAQTGGTSYYWNVVPYNVVGSAEDCVKQSYVTDDTACYCDAGATSTSFEKISNVTFADINHDSTSTAGYENHTTEVGNVNLGETYTFTADFSGTSYDDDQVLVWIDFNQDGDFEDDGEEVLVTVVGMAPWSGDITIPLTATLGQTRMRVRLHDSVLTPNITPCGNSGFGQVEDYTININPTLSIGTVDNSGFTYFPNPVKNTLQLNAQSNIQNVSVFNMLGQEVLRTTPNNVNSTVDMSALQTGAYFVKVTINDRTETVRVIKQ